MRSKAAASPLRRRPHICNKAKKPTGVVVISHDMKDVRQVADRVVVLRLGSTVAAFRRGEYTPSDLISAMTGAHEGADL